MLLSCDSIMQSPAVSERRKATISFTLDCCTPGRRGFLTGATVSAKLLGKNNPSYKHGYAGQNRPPEYSVWKGMRSRCLPNSAKRKFYFDRGIAVCPRWNDFKNFFNDMGARPTPNHSIDRINNNLGYSPSNCRWATKSQQMNNTTKNAFLTFGGVKKTVTQWAKEYGLKQSRLSLRLKYGWTAERALTQSPEVHKHRTRELRLPFALRADGIIYLHGRRALSIEPIKHFKRASSISERIVGYLNAGFALSKAQP